MCPFPAADDFAVATAAFSGLGTWSFLPFGKTPSLRPRDFPVARSKPIIAHRQRIWKTQFRNIFPL
jgi:hypothetical protein